MIRFKLNCFKILSISFTLFISGLNLSAQVSFSGTFNLAGGGNNVSSFNYNGTLIDNVEVSALTKNGITSSSSSGNFRGTNWPLADR